MIKFYLNRIPGHKQPRLKYGKIRNVEMIWLGPCFILITNRQRLMHPIQWHKWNKRCKAQFPC